MDSEYGNGNGYDLIRVWQGGHSASEPAVPSIENIYNGVPGDTLSITSAPEPSTWAMILAGFAGLGALKFKFKRKSLLTIA